MVGDSVSLRWLLLRTFSWRTSWILIYLRSGSIEALTPHAISLADRNDPLCECWYNLSNPTNQRVYLELVYRNGSRLKKWLQPPPPLLSPASSRFIFLFTLSQFSGDDYVGAWNRLLIRMFKRAEKRCSPVRSCPTLHMSEDSGAIHKRCLWSDARSRLKPTEELHFP